ncbi:S8 family serine peptidase [Anaerococcus hydrogenalis]|uniref:S8 family serine peptidase n=1 Tax=Anaerococcus hydrogenalis TaxID=33029 RepID=UPI0023F12336|nr:S8 family serine peptidase [Anaerococcus hydrogenalis]
MKSYRKIAIGFGIGLLAILVFYFGKGFLNSDKNKLKNSKNPDVILSDNKEKNSNSNSKAKAKYIEKRVSMKENYPQKSQKLEFSDKKNFFTIPGYENIKEDDFGEYVDGEILVDVDLDKFDEKIFDKYGAKIIGKCDTWGGYQINIPNKSVDELEKIAEKIKKEEGVVVSRVHWLIPVGINESYPDDNFKIGKKNFDKNNLWDGYDLDKGFDRKNKISEDDPYWSYKITNLSYMWKNLDFKEESHVGVFENGKIGTSKNKETLIEKDLDFQNLNTQVIEDENKRSKSEKFYKEATKDMKIHTYLVSSILAARHNNLGFSGVGKDTKVYPTVFDFSIFPYLLAYRIDNSSNQIKIFNLSWGYLKEVLYYLNTDKENIEKDSKSKNRTLRRIAKFGLRSEGKNQKQYYRRFQLYLRDNSMVYNVALKKLKEQGKDFLIVNSAGDEGEIIRDIEEYSDVEIKKTTFFEEVDDDIKKRIIIIGASKPEINKNGKTIFWKDSTTRNLDIVAPGNNVPGYDKNGKLMLWDGTSASAPFVAGLAANLYSAYPDKMNGELAKELIVKSGNIDVIDEFNGENSKLVDAKKLTDLAKEKFGEEKEEKKEEKKINRKIIRENKKDDNKGNLDQIENVPSNQSSNKDQENPPSASNDENLSKDKTYKVIQDGKDQEEISILDMGDAYFIDVDKLNEIYFSDSLYLTDPEYSDIANKYKKILAENQGRHIKENSDGTYYFGLFPGNIDVSENIPNYAYQYFPDYGVFAFSRYDYMKEDKVCFLPSKYAGVILDGKLYVDSNWLAWSFGFELDYTFDSKNKIFEYKREGHDIGQEGVDYINISTENYGDIYELLDDNFEKIN